MRPWISLLSAAALALAACTSSHLERREEGIAPPAPAALEGNPILARWDGPHGGAPRFEGIRPEHFPPALEAAIEERRREVAAITDNPAAPTFENTLAALEDSGRRFKDVVSLEGIWGSALSSPEFQALERELNPRITASEDEVVQNEKLFQRIEAVYHSPEQAGLTPEQRRLCGSYYTDFVRAGAKLDAAARKRLAELNQRLTTIYPLFSQNVLADGEDLFVELDTEADLAGLSESERRSAQEAARARGHEGHWIIVNKVSSVESFLAHASRRDLREKVWRLYVNRGDNGGAHDNNAFVSEILQLRAERAKLLGYETQVHWRTENAMARTPERALALLESVWKPAVARVHEEVAEMQALADREGAGWRIEPWDYRYYAEKVRAEKYDLDPNEVRSYLQMEKLREGMFWVAGQLLGLTFTPVSDVSVYHPDVRVWEVQEARSGRHVGLWYFDPYARPGKRSGNWMYIYRYQERFRGEVGPLVSVNTNSMKPPPGEPALLSWSEAEALFHEFGHSLHALSSRVEYPSLASTLVPRDYSEFPSQLFASWVATPEVLGTYAVHVRTGQPMPAALVHKLRKAATFNQGFLTVEYLASALMDLKLHLAGGQKIDPRAFERDTLAALGMPREMVMRQRVTHFIHAFAGDAFSGGYYSYLWADTLAADAWEAFLEGQGPYDPAVAERLRAQVLSVGNAVDPAEGYRAFRGRDPDSAALMRKRGFPVTR